jgi:hypothetical protein
LTKDVAVIFFQNILSSKQDLEDEL